MAEDREHASEVILSLGLSNRKTIALLSVVEAEGSNMGDAAELLADAIRNLTRERDTLVSKLRGASISKGRRRSRASKLAAEGVAQEEPQKKVVHVGPDVSHETVGKIVKPNGEDTVEAKPTAKKKVVATAAESPTA